MRHEVHTITRRIVDHAKRMNAVIVVGDLGGIRNQNKGRALQSSLVWATLLPIQATVNLQSELGRDTGVNGFGSVHFADL